MLSFHDVTDVITPKHIFSAVSRDSFVWIVARHVRTYRLIVGKNSLKGLLEVS